MIAQKKNKKKKMNGTMCILQKQNHRNTAFFRSFVLFRLSILYKNIWPSIRFCLVNFLKCTNSSVTE